MKNIGNRISRALLSLAVAGMGLTLTPQMASADILFDVDETVVPDASIFGCAIVDCTFDTDLINGAYNEKLTVNADGSFDVSALASFTEYWEDGFPVPSTESALGLPELLGGYAMYATLTGSGFILPDGTITFTGATVTLYLDPDQDNSYGTPATGTGSWTVTDPGSLDDLEVLSSSTLIDGGGSFDPGEDSGDFDLDFGSLLFTAFGDLYFPGLSSLGIVFSTVDGDFNNVPNPPAPGTYTVIGDLSVVYDVESVPEPATMTLLGLGLLGSGVAARRRRKA